MKKIYLSLLALVCAINFSYAQNTSPWPSSGSVGIGTISPQTQLHIYQPIADQPGLIIQGNTINIDRVQHYVGLTLDCDYGNATGNYSQIRSYGNLYSDWGSQLAFYTTQKGAVNTLVERMRIDAFGNVGIGTTSPTAILHAMGSEYVPGVSGSAQNSNLRIGASSTNLILDFGVTTTGSIYSWLQSRSQATYSVNYNLALNPNGGNVGIGTTSPDEKLTVNGTIHSKEVKVDLSIFPDYVFKPNYHLPTLTEVKTYIDKNHHLPDMPSEAEVVKNGLNLGKTQSLLTKKVEELTLYLIEKDKEISNQQKQLNKLKQQISTLSKHK